MKTNEHPPQKILVDYAMRDEFMIPEETISWIEKHLSDCESCRNSYKILRDRYEQFNASYDAADHFRKITSKLQRKKSKMKFYYISAAAVLIFSMSYGTTFWIMNREFDYSDTGLAEFGADYSFACETMVYRDEETVESREISLFKEGILTLFDAKKTTLGLFPHYDMKIVNAAESVFLKIDSVTSDKELKERTGLFLRKISAIKAKKEIKK